MNNKYFEYAIKPKNENREKTIKNILFALKISFIVLTVVFGYFAFMFSNLMWVLFGVFLTVSLVLNYFQHKFYCFYDLIFVDGDVSVTKVINNVKRRRLLKFSCKKIEKIGFLGGETFNKYIKDKSVKKYYVTESLDGGDVCILIDDVDKKMLLFPYEEYFLVQVLKYAGPNKLEKQFIEKIKNKLWCILIMRQLQSR